MAMTRIDLQRRLIELDFYEPDPVPGGADGIWGQKTSNGILKAMTDGPDTPLGEADITRGVAVIGHGVRPAHIWTSWDIESTGKPFLDGRPTILPEPHRFSKATGHRYDVSHPHISSRAWNRRLYPARQADRWVMLLQMVALDVDAGFASTSYGGFQILGENYRACGAASPFDFALEESRTVGAQVDDFCGFVLNNGLAAKLAACRPGDPASCIPFVSAYNGTAFRLNNYHDRFAADLRRRWR